MPGPLYLYATRSVQSLAEPHAASRNGNTEPTKPQYGAGAISLSNAFQSERFCATLGKASAGLKLKTCS